MHNPEQKPDPEYIRGKVVDTIDTAKELENRISVLAFEAGRGPVGLALNTAKTQVSLAVGMLIRAAQDGAPVGSG